MGTDDRAVPVLDDDEGSDDDLIDDSPLEDDATDGDDRVIVEDQPTVLGAVVSPEAAITAACIADDGALAVEVLLDNRGSTTEVEYTVAVGDAVEQVTVGALETATRSDVIDAGDGDVEVVVTAADANLASETFSASEACGTEVLGVVEVRGDDAADASDAAGVAAEHASDVAVLGETVERTGLPRTGASALLLAVAGLTALGVGGGLLATRRTGMVTTQ